MQAVAPLPPWYFPAAQAEQALVPAEAAKKPEEHDKQAAALRPPKDGLAVPEGQMVQEVAPVPALKVPAEQNVQLVEPVAGVYEPLAQPKQAGVPVFDANFPTPQLTH